MMRRALPLFMAVALATPASAAGLRGAEVHVSGDVVTLADIFDGVSTGGELQIAKSPPPGKTILLDGQTLHGIAVVNHVDWQPRGMTEHVIVFRDGDAVTGMPAPGASAGIDEALQILTPALGLAGAGSKLAVLLDSGETQVHVAALPAGLTLAAENVIFDKASRRFTATLVNAVTGERLPTSGRAIAMIDVPVPARPIAQGDVVTAADLTTISQRADELRSDTVTTQETFVGKVAKRPLQPNQAVQARFLGVPALIHRGDRVTMIVRAGDMMLTAEGHALADAGLGESVRISNAASAREVEGRVTGPNMAEIRTETAIVAAAAIPATGAATAIRQE